ncbi:MAG: hypothetical protein L0H53_16340 [Candidatus Nitrosocosmicus sp.]|nr:hypothetical protein [Candidatus Nitrosocosmicus sp.]MDN5869049.1 hypothetical protein [Candidatus Nitrosocosmicus sp.]
MNIIEIPFEVEAKTMGNQKTKNVSYYFNESPHGLCLDREEIMLAQIHACERLFKLTKDQTELVVIEKEIAKIKFAIEHMKG